MDKPVMVVQKLMTKDEVASFLRCSPRHVDKLKAEQGLPFRKLGHLIRFEWEAVLQWLQKQETSLERSVHPWQA